MDEAIATANAALATVTECHAYAIHESEQLSGELDAQTTHYTKLQREISRLALRFGVGQELPNSYIEVSKAIIDSFELIEEAEIPLTGAEETAAEEKAREANQLLKEFVMRCRSHLDIEASDRDTKLDG